MSPSSSNSTNGAPMAIFWPISPCRAETLPATGEVISTVALSVMTSTSGWSSSSHSPGLHMPGGDFRLSDAFADIGQAEQIMRHAQPSCVRRKRGGHPRRAGEIIPFEGVRIGRVPARDALDRRFEMIEAAFLHQGGNLRAETAEARRLMHDHAAPGFFDGGE